MEVDIHHLLDIIDFHLLESYNDSTIAVGLYEFSLMEHLDKLSNDMLATDKKELHRHKFSFNESDNDFLSNDDDELDDLNSLDDKIKSGRQLF